MSNPITIAVTGPESSGKSTLTEQLSQSLNCPFVGEYARVYLDKINRDYKYEDLEKIAKGQTQLWFAAILQSPKILILDTELTVIKIWSKYKYNKVSQWVSDHLKNQKIDLYLLCKPNLKWIDDPQRENPIKSDRNELYNLYLTELKKLKRNFVVIDEIGEERLNQAIEAINDVFLKEK